MIKRIGVLILVGKLATMAHGSAVPTDYTGHYELVDNHSERVFTLDLSQKGSRVHVAFFAAVLNDAGAKPTGKGQGRVNDHGLLEFSFKDSFLNEGTASFAPAGDGYRVEMRITKFVDPAPLHFYGALTLKKATGTPPKIVSSG